MRPARIEALCDGIFAIVMTLLVLELKLPVFHGETESVSLLLSESLVDLWPKLLAFIISFVIIAIYWSSHHIQFTYINRTNFLHMWLNIFLMLFISLIPFSTGLLGEYPQEQISILIYGANLILCGLILYVSWRYATWNDRLVEKGSVSAIVQRNSRFKILLPPLLYTVALVLSFTNTSLSLYFFALGPIIYFIPVSSGVWDKIIDPLGHQPQKG